MKKVILIALLFITGASYAGGENDKTVQQELKEHIKHDQWNELLQKYVTPAGKVNYAGLKDNVAKLDAYLDLLAKNPAQPGWPIAERKAYWINAYNAFTIKLILDRYPVKSINDVSAKPWDKRFIKIGKITHTLNEIENKILRRQFEDSRIHFAINCASISCPKLNNKAFTMFNVEKELTRLTKEFFKSKNVELTEKSAKISKIFEWYKDDFVSETGSIISYIEKYSGMKFHPKVKVSYMEYNWGLNKQ